MSKSSGQNQSGKRRSAMPPSATIFLRKISGLNLDLASFGRIGAAETNRVGAAAGNHADTRCVVRPVSLAQETIECLTNSHRKIALPTNRSPILTAARCAVMYLRFRPSPLLPPLVLAQACLSHWCSSSWRSSPLRRSATILPLPMGRLSPSTIPPQFRQTRCRLSIPLLPSPQRLPPRLKPRPRQHLTLRPHLTLAPLTPLPLPPQWTRPHPQIRNAWTFELITANGGHLRAPAVCMSGEPKC